MTVKPFQSKTRWIWSRAATRPYHNVVCFRRTLPVEGAARGGVLTITADSRYDVYVNGAHLGHGPIRSWPSPWPVDTFDLRGLLRPGRNVIAVLVQHWGIDTFQYLLAEPGLIAEATWQDQGGRHHVGTDSTWRSLPHQGYLWPVPRLACQQGWEEQFDARVLPEDWTTADDTNTDWPPATVTHPAGQGPHPKFVRREIPMLTCEPVEPIRVRSVEAVRPARYSWALNPRDLLNPTDKSANLLRGKLLLLTYIYSDREQPADFHPPHQRPVIPWKLNGKPLAFDDASLLKTETSVAHAKLRKGWNTLMGRLPDEEHLWWAVLNVWTGRAVRFDSRPTQAPSRSPWLALGPFGQPHDSIDANQEAKPATAPEQDHRLSPPEEPASVMPGGVNPFPVEAAAIPAGATLAQFHKIWRRGFPLDEDLHAAYARPLTHDMIAGADVYAQCASERVVEPLVPEVENLSALLHDTPDWTVIHPLKDADVRLLLDFGREVVGFHEFEIDAPAGTIIDNHNFEFIQPDGRFNLAEGMNNSFRYICREGPQRYRTLLRRGFQYSWLSLRQFHRPVRIRFVRLLMSTYPQARQGAFACSDPLLDRVWEAGAHSVRCCSEDTYTDCPSYEQTFWVGDARNEALVDLVANGDPRLSAHGWKLAAQSLDRSPLVESQVPSGWQNILPAWSFLWMRWAQEHFLLTGDRPLGLLMLEQLERNVAGIRHHLSDRGLIKIEAWNMFDWAPMETPSGGEVTHLNCLAVLGLRQAAEMAKQLGAAGRSKAWTKLADLLSRAINRHLWYPRRKAYIDCLRPDGSRSTVYSQQTQTAAYIAGVPPDANFSVAGT